MNEKEKFYLIKRSPDFSRNGIIVKRNKKIVYSERRINGKPPSHNLKENDIIYVYEKNYGIYAKGVVTIPKNVIKTFNSVESIIDYYTKAKSKDDSFWIEMIQRLNNKKKENTNAVLYYHEYTVDQKLLDRVIPLNDKLKDLKKINSFGKIEPHLIQEIENYKSESITELKEKIPNDLRFNLYSLFNLKHKVSVWIDIDHFVPKSVGGPGNIPENLVPVGFSLNRYKSNSIPKGLFCTADDEKDLNISKISKYTVKDDEYFYSSNEAKEKAREIVDIVNKFPDIKKKRNFYKKVLKYHHPEYVKLIKDFEI